MENVWDLIFVLVKLDGKVKIVEHVCEDLDVNMVIVTMLLSANVI